MMAGVTLRTWRPQGAVSLAEALSVFARAAAVRSRALLYAPAACEFAWIAPDGKPEFAPASRLGRLDTVFEARAFCDAAELRWVRTGAGRGDAALLSEGTLEVAWPERSTLAVEKLDLARGGILWGRFHGKQAGADWVELAEARIGCLAVPWDAAADAKSTPWFRLTSVEYAAPMTDGNMSVIAERLTGIAAYKGG